MSIWATWLSFQEPDEHEDDCTRWNRLTEGIWHLTGEGCQCKVGPIVYQGSHVLPSNEDGRGGDVQVAACNTFIRRDDRPDLPTGDIDEDCAWPWLRLSVNQADVVLDLAQVRELHDTLERWLELVVDVVQVAEVNEP